MREDTARLAGMRRWRFWLISPPSPSGDRNAYQEAVTAYEWALVLGMSRPDCRGRDAIGEAYATLARGDDAWEHALRGIEVLKGLGRTSPRRYTSSPLPSPRGTGLLPTDAVRS